MQSFKKYLTNIDLPAVVVLSFTVKQNKVSDAYTFLEVEACCKFMSPSIYQVVVGRDKCYEEEDQ